VSAVEDSFFEIGGHSLLATPGGEPHPRKACRSGCGCRPSFDAPTVAGLAKVLESALT